MENENLGQEVGPEETKPDTEVQTDENAQEATGSTVPTPEQTGDKNSEEQPAPGSVNTVGN